MKIPISISLLLAFTILIPNSLQAQEENQLEKEIFRGLRKEMVLVALLHPKDTSDNQYLGYSFEVLFRKDGGVSISYTHGTPKRVMDRQGYAEEKLEEFMKQENICFKEDHIVLYPVLHVWKDKRDRKDNLIEVMEGLFADGKEYPDTVRLRVEKPIVTKLLEGRY